MDQKGKPVRIVQFIRFNLPADQETPILDAQRVSTDECRASHPELREVLLVRLEGGDWLDIALWDSETQTSILNDAEFPPPDARRDFFDQIDQLLGQETGQLVRPQAGCEQDKPRNQERELS
jgi:hypothetical protein